MQLLGRKNMKKTGTRAGRPVQILLVEDNPADARLTMELLGESKILNNLHVVEDGEQALAYLHKEGEYGDASRPDLILLDLRIPKIDGPEVLAQIKQDPGLKRIPVVILTASRAEEDIIRTYDLHANAYVSKPIGFEQFLEVVKTIEDFWLTIVKLPPS